MPSLNSAGRVVPDIVPGLLPLLDELGLTEAIASRVAFETADAAHADAIAALDDLEDELADRPADARRAGLTGGKAPAVHASEYDEGRREALRLKIKAAEREARKCAAALEDAVLEARPALRARLVEQLPEDHATAVTMYEEFLAADARQRATASAIRALDLRAARRIAEHPHDADTLGGAIHDHYAQAVDQQDLSRFRTMYLSSALQDVAAWVRGLPVEGFAADPFESPRMKAAQAHVAERVARTRKAN